VSVININRAQLKAKKNDLALVIGQLESEIQSCCQEIQYLAEWRTLESLEEIDSPAIRHAANRLVELHSRLVGANSRLENINGALYG